MQAVRTGGKVVVTMTAKEAADVEDDLLWVGESNKHAIKLWEALSELAESETRSSVKESPQ